MSRKPIRGFTLVEILVALGILVLLCAVLMGVFSRVRDSAQLTSCAGNMKQLHLALAAYAADNDGVLPPFPSRATPSHLDSRLPFRTMLPMVEMSRELLSSTLPYTHSQALWRCPSDHLVWPPNSFQGGLPIPNLTSYHYYGFKTTQKGIVGRRLDFSNRMFSPTNYPLLYDGINLLVPDANKFALYLHDQYNHQGRLNTLYLDGHIKCGMEPIAIS